MPNTIPRTDECAAGQRAADFASIASERLHSIVDMFIEAEDSGEGDKHERNVREVLYLSLGQLAADLQKAHDSYYDVVKTTEVQ